MSNEKPVRITVGDVKEVTEATTIQGDALVSRSSSASSYPASSGGNLMSGTVLGSGLIGLALFVVAGYFGLVHGVTSDKAAAPTKSSVAAPDAKTTTGNDASNSTSANAPATTTSPDAANTVTGPADKAVTQPPSDLKSFTGNSAIAANNAPAANNGPAANNSPSK